MPFYASEVWNPNTITEINPIEQIQRAAARFVFEDYRRTTHVTPLIEQLDWDKLHICRLIQQATTMYRIHYNLVNLSPPPCFKGHHIQKMYLWKTESSIEIC